MELDNNMQAQPEPDNYAAIVEDLLRRGIHEYRLTARQAGALVAALEALKLVEEIRAETELIEQSPAAPPAPDLPADPPPDTPEPPAPSWDSSLSPCPACGGRDFAIQALYTATDFISITEGGDFEVEDTRYGDGEWEDESEVRCVACDHRMTYAEWRDLDIPAADLENPPCQ